MASCKRFSPFCLRCVFSCLSKTCFLYWLMFVSSLTYPNLPEYVTDHYPSANYLELLAAVSFLGFFAVSMIWYLFARRRFVKCCLVCLARSVTLKCLVVSAMFYSFQAVRGLFPDYQHSVEMFPCHILVLASLIPVAAFQIVAEQFCTEDKTTLCSPSSCARVKPTQGKSEAKVTLPAKPNSTKNLVSLRIFQLGGSKHKKTKNVKDMVRHLNTEPSDSKPSPPPLPLTMTTPTSKVASNEDCKELPFLGELEGRFRSTIPAL